MTQSSRESSTDTNDKQSFETYRVRIWLLLLLAAASRAGFPKLSKSRLHRILFLSNCLAPVYRNQAPFNLVAKYVRGPFYAEAQWDIDRLSIQGYANIARLEFRLDKYGPWADLDYSISKKGYELVESVMDLDTVAPIWEFMLDLCTAYANVDQDQRDTAAIKDVTYDQPGVPEKGVIDFDELTKNLSVSTTNTFVELAPEMLKPGRQDKLRLYLKYLELRAA